MRRVPIFRATDLMAERGRSALLYPWFSAAGCCATPQPRRGHRAPRPLCPRQGAGSREHLPEEIQGSRTTSRYFRDGSQNLLAGGSEGDGGAGGGQGGPKGEPRRPPPEPNHPHRQLAHAGWASSLTATLCLPQVGQLKRGTLVFERICSVHVSARICACSSRDILGPGRASRSLLSRKCRA